MIISRTPFRISFAGGGTDIKAFWEREEGQVLSTSIDKYLYVTTKRQLDIVEHKYRVSYSAVEFKNEIHEIEHPIVREALSMMRIDFPVEITTFNDVPGHTGLGSSSTFGVGLLHALFALQGKMVTKHELASLAAMIEVDRLRRNMGVQDHFAAAYGSMNIFTFMRNGDVRVEPVFYNPAFKAKIEANLMMFYTAVKRDASEILRKQIESTPQKLETLRKMRDLVPRLARVISEGREPRAFGDILHEGWCLKREMTEDISSPQIDYYYDRARQAGAVGGKLLGAGGGGFLLFYVEQDRQASVEDALSDLFRLRFAFDHDGTRITYYDQSRFV